MHTPCSIRSNGLAKPNRTPCRNRGGGHGGQAPVGPTTGESEPRAFCGSSTNTEPSLGGHSGRRYHGFVFFRYLGITDSTLLRRGPFHVKNIFATGYTAIAPRDFLVNGERAPKKIRPVGCSSASPTPRNRAQFDLVRPQYCNAPGGVTAAANKTYLQGSATQKFVQAT